MSAPETAELPYEAWIVALLALPGMGPARLNVLLEHGDAPAMWERLRSGRIELDTISSTVRQRWQVAANQMSVEAHWDAITSLGIRVEELGSNSYPERLANDIEAPQMLFSLGEPLSPGPTVAIVGTRNCTAYGQRCAFEIAALLTDAGVSVVSGLALGIDAAAHRGALSVAPVEVGRPVGVVGSGLDIIYPKRNAGLWRDISTSGTLLSETPPGVGPDKWRFPARNRIIAGLSDAVIVIESHESGGSLITVDEAQLRDIPVGAVPGPITSNAAAGTNRLLADGATPILGVDDVLALIGHVRPTPVDSADPSEVSSAVLDAMGWTAMTLEQICVKLSLPATEVAIEIERLVGSGLCARTGPWIERVR